MQDAIICPTCGANMILRSSPRHPYANGNPRRFYGCSSFPECDTTMGSHPDGTPYGKPADKATKAARIRAHCAFDQLWQVDGMNRSQAYVLLQQLMGLSQEDAHISLFDEDQCDELISRIRGWRGRRYSDATE